MPKFTATYLSGLKPKAKRYVVTEGNGFYIEVMPTGEKSFRYRYRLNGKREKVTIGSYPSMTLKVAHIKHATMLEKVNLGESPAHSKREARLQAAAGLDPQDTFGYLAEKWIEQVLKPANKNSRQDEIYVRRDIIPKIGSKLPQAINTQDVWSCVEAVKARGHGQAARRVRSVLKRVFDYAMSHGVTQTNPASAVKPTHIAVTKTRSRALRAQEILSWLHAIETSSIARSTKLALRFLLLVPVRKGELISAKWRDVDFGANTWDIPEHASKNGTPLRHKLPAQAMAVLRELKQLAMDSQWVLPSSRGLGKNHISSSTMNTAVRGITGLPQDVVIHDLRRTVRTYLSELGVASNVAELCLNHRPSGVRGVYDRSELIEQRYAALQKWENYVQTLLHGEDADANVPKIPAQFGEMLQQVQADPALRRYLLGALLDQS
ncbi:MAG TPA: integrase arm-type DNA-binding domain-containing protein [Rhodanobacter sp.]|nr:integrase arm-type DNA-binding domain-containing protein [Rhodanobacter sp.]